MSGWREAGTADRVRSSPEAMATVLREVALREDAWTGPFGAMTERLHEVARVDLCLARLVEGHADAMRILDQADAKPAEGVYGVWASRSVGTGVRALREGDGWRLTGEIRFASGIDLIDRALLPGWIDDATHLLFDVPLDRFDADRDTWHTAAMQDARSFTVHVDAAWDDPPVGPENFYLGRPGFTVGGLEVAAVWAGGAQCVVDLVAEGLRAFHPSAHQLRRLGVMQQAAWEADTALGHAVRLVEEADEVPVTDITAARSAVVTACERVLDEAGRIVGPAGLSSTARLARTLADLAIYVRQHHLDATLESGGREAMDGREVIG